MSTPPTGRSRINTGAKPAREESATSLSDIRMCGHRGAVGIRGSVGTGVGLHPPRSFRTGISRHRGRAQEGTSSQPAEVLGKEETSRRIGQYAYPDFGEKGAENVRPVSGGIHPCRHDFRRTAVTKRDVLAVGIGAGPGVIAGFHTIGIFLGKSGVCSKSAANCAAVGRKTLGNSGGGINSAVPNGQAEVKPRGVGRAITEPAATGRITSETSGRIPRPTTGRSQRTVRQKTTGNAGRIAELAEHQEARRTGTEAGTSLADVLRAIAALSDADRELLMQLLKALQGTRP